MFGFPVSLVVSFTLFTTFLFYQQKHVSTFQGASQAFVLLLSFFALVGFVFELGFLLYFGYQTSIWTAVKLVGLGVVLWIPLMMLEVSVSSRVPVFYVLLSLAGFVAMPVCAYFMVLAIP